MRRCSGKAGGAKISPSRTSGAPPSDNTNTRMAAPNSATPDPSARRRKSSWSSGSSASSVRYTAARKANAVSANTPTESANGVNHGAT